MHCSGKNNNPSFFVLIFFCSFSRLHKNHLHGSLIMLCISILVVNCLYIPFSLTQSNPSDLLQSISCIVLGFLFHYFLLASFTWMLIMAIVQYLHFVRIFNSHISHFFLKSCIIGWLVPVLFPSLVVVMGSNGGYIGASRCWINDQILLYFTFLTPISLIVGFNLIVFGFILKSIYHRNTVVVSHQKNHSKIQMGAALCCFVSIGKFQNFCQLLPDRFPLGCTWLFGIIVLLEPNFVHQLIFCLCNSLQGFFIFLFHVYLSKPKREFWGVFFTRHESHKPSEIITISSNPKYSTKDHLTWKSSNNEQTKSSNAS